MIKLGAFVLAAILPVVSFAAVVFEPVQYQYRDPMHDRPSFFYGGADPAVIIAGRVQQIRSHMGANPVRNIGFSETYVGSQNSDLIHHGVSGDICVTYSDLLPAGVNAFVLGMTPDDARNDAYAATPRFFHVRDLMQSAIMMPDGNVVVPSQPMAGTIQMMPAHKRVAAPTTQPASQPVIIFPKELLDKKLIPPARTPMASAN
jgi:hypothetical protein